MWQRLETDNILLLAPRRVGKTSLLYKLEASAAQHGYRPVFVSVASHEHELAFLQALLEAVAMSTRFRRKVAGRARKLLARVIEHMLDKVGWLIPYHLQVLFSLVRDLDLARPDIEAVERAYAEMLSNHHKGYFDPWVQRLRDELGSTDEGHALALLEVAALDPSGAPGSVVYGLMHSRGVELEHTRYLLGVLVNDGYLVVVDGRWQFRSPLLRDYWRRMVAP